MKRRKAWRMSRTHRYSHSRANSPSFPSLQLCHSSFSNRSLALPTSQLILQPFRCFTYVEAHSPTLLSLLLRHRIFTYVTWRAAHVQELPGSIPGYTLEILLEVQGLERGSHSLVRTIGQLLDMRSSEIRLRKLKLRLRDKRFANHKAPCTAIWYQPLQSVLALRGCSATDFFIYAIKQREYRISI